MTTRMNLAEFKALEKPKKPKFNAVPVVIDGIRFASRAEGEFYQLLKADKAVLHVDVHPSLTLPGGIHYRPDFVVYRGKFKAPGRESRRLLDVEVFEVKGAVTQDFRRMRKLFDATHPLAPLKVYRLRGKRWEAI